MKNMINKCYNWRQDAGRDIIIEIIEVLESDLLVYGLCCFNPPAKQFVITFERLLILQPNFQTFPKLVGLFG